MNRAVSNILPSGAIFVVLAAVFAIGPVIADRAGPSQALANESMRTIVAPIATTPSPIPKLKSFQALQPSDLSSTEKMQMQIKQLSQQVADLQAALKQMRDGTAQDIQSLKNEDSSLAGNLNSLAGNLNSLNDHFGTLNQQFAAHHHTLDLFQEGGIIVKGQSNNSISGYSTSGVFLLTTPAQHSSEAHLNTSGPK